MNAYIHSLVSVVIISESKVISTSVILLCDAQISASLEFVEIVHVVKKFAGSSEFPAQLGSAAQESMLANFGFKRLENDQEELYKRLLTIRAKS